MKILAEFEYTVGEKTCRIIMPPDMPIASAKEVMFAFLKHLGNLEDKAKEQADAAAASEAQAEETPIEVVNE